MEQRNKITGEEEVLKFWQDHDILAKVMSHRAGKEKFVFYEGPPSANARPGIHHILSRVYKDIFIRYQTMLGKDVTRQAGWDTHGLPIELAVEKKLHIAGKKEIEKFGIGEFNKQAKDLVFEYIDEWEKITDRIGFWLDKKNPYITYSNDYIEKLWGVLADINKRGHLYKSYKVVPHCPRCETALSSHEVAQGYKKVTEDSIFVRFKVKDAKNTFLLAWTTTPWTLPGNVALAVNKDIEYIYANNGVETLILAKDKKSILNDGYKVEKVVKGKDLVGISYDPLFEIAFGSQQKSHFVLPADFVNTEEGTGIVHTAVMYGADDFEVGLEYDLPQVHTVSEDGKFNQLVKKWQGRSVKDTVVQKEIVKDLADRGLVYKTLSYTHDYPFCWRCDTPLLYYAKDSWFIAVEKLRQQLVIGNETINWIPDNIKQGRFGSWLKDAKDWALSRERYWGTPLPVWRCQTSGSRKSEVRSQSNDCENIEVIGSLADLRSRIPDSEFRILDSDLHCPSIDKVTWACSKCKTGIMTREPYVIDVWFDSGAMPIASGKFQQGEYPADYICEAVDQTRGWFYTLLAVAVATERSAPYKNVICLGHLLDTKGQKMSKSKGNTIDPWQVIEKYGVDALRIYFFGMNQAGQSKRFNENDLETAKRKVVGLSQNICNFYNMYQQDNNRFSEKSSDAFSLFDSWVDSFLAQKIQVIRDQLDNFDATASARIIEEIIDTLANWYLRRSRKRTDKDFIPHLRQTLNLLARLMAPFTPFVAEEIYQATKSASDPKSVHLTDYPKADEFDEKLVSQMNTIRQVASLGLMARAKAQIKVRQPLNLVMVKAPKVDAQLFELLKDELNVKEVAWTANDSIEVELDTDISPELKREGDVREYIRTIQMLRKQAKLKSNQSVSSSIEDQLSEKEKIEIEQATNSKLSSQIINSEFCQEKCCIA